MMFRITLSSIASVILFAVVGEPAQAQNARTWISGIGVDQSGCGPIANPCRTLQYAHDATAPGGEIDVKDSAGYGSVTITKSISIIEDGSLSGVLATANRDAITISAGSSDTIVLRGLTIEGAKAGSNGIVYYSGGTLDIAFCTIQNFNGQGLAGNGILLQPVSGSTSISIVDTTSSHNGNDGLYYLPKSGSTASSTMHLSRLNTSQNGRAGVELSGASASSGVTNVTVSGSVAANNAIAGYIAAKIDSVSVDLSAASGNGFYGFATAAGATMTVGRSVAAHNKLYGFSQGDGTLLSYGDNRLVGNSQPTSGTIGVANTY